MPATASAPGVAYKTIKCVEARFGDNFALVFGRASRDEFDRPAVRRRFTDVIQAVFQSGELRGLTHAHILQRR
jgi:hypothetical protein